MSAQTESVTETLSGLSVTLEAPIHRPKSRTAPGNPLYQIEEREPVNKPVPFGSSLAVTAHFVTWIFWLLYFVLRLPAKGTPSKSWFWVFYFCEAAFVAQEFQSAFELTFSLLGPRRLFQHAQYILKGTQAPDVDVLVT